MARGAAARRYAKALFELSREAGRVTEVREEIGQLAGLLKENADLRDVLLRPLHPVSQRRSVLAAVTEKLGASSVVKSFTSLLIDQRRLVDFQAIRNEFERLADEEDGLTQARVLTASPLREDQLERLRAALGRRTGRKVALEVKVDEKLLGGVIAQVGDLVFDGSLRTQLRQLRDDLVRG